VFEQVAAQAAELNAKLARTIIRALRNVLEIMMLSSSAFFACVRLSSPEFPSWPQKRPPLSAQSLFAST
jgi:hypothetical protein